MCEVYPDEKLIGEQNLPYNSFGDEISCAMPPYSVRYIHIRPVFAENEVKVCGLKNDIVKTADGHTITVNAPQRTTQRIGIALSPDQAFGDVTARQAPAVRRFTFPVAVKIVRKAGSFAWLDVTFPREAAPAEIRNWHLREEKVELRLPAENCEFQGALISRAFSENYDVCLEVKTIENREMLEVLKPLAKPESRAAPKLQFLSGKKYIFSAKFFLLFIFTHIFLCLIFVD